MADAALLRLIAALACRASRAEAAQELARALNAENLLIFVPDPGVEALLPAPGFPQTLRDPQRWLAFLAACAGQPECRGRLPHPDYAEPRDALGLSGADGSLLVLFGGAPCAELAREVAQLLPMLSAAFGAERIAREAASQTLLAKQSNNQAGLLATSLERARQTLRTALAEAEAANKAKDEFLAALSHELRTPLNPVLMAANAMESDPALPAEVREQAAVIRRNAEVEARLIDDLLDLTRITHGKLKLVTATVDVHLLLDETYEIISSEGGMKPVVVEFLKAASSHHVVGDAARLLQVFWNLIKNAIKFTPAGGSVFIVTANPEPGRLTVRVTDNGIGISAEVIPLIFNAFEQGHAAAQPRFGGLGLGLAITKAIVALHNGHISAESEGLERGASFTVELQTTVANAPPSPALAHEASAFAPLRLLLVEDHDSTREVLTRVLRRAGHEVHVAASAEEAMEVVAAITLVDIVISDLGLPGQTGFELMRLLKDRYALRGIALSGYGMDEDLRQAREAGFEAHLIKPISIEQLLSLLQKLGPRVS